MTAEPLALVLRYVRQLADAEELAALPDGQLLERFALREDAAAFAVLVERYAGLVLGGCRRLLPNAQDAEDAFQATPSWSWPGEPRRWTGAARSAAGCTPWLIAWR